MGKMDPFFASLGICYFTNSLHNGKINHLFVTQQERRDGRTVDASDCNDQLGFGSINRDLQCN